jgi:hypothetical protein
VLVLYRWSVEISLRGRVSSQRGQRKHSPTPDSIVRIHYDQFRYYHRRLIMSRGSRLPCSGATAPVILVFGLRAGQTGDYGSGANTAWLELIMRLSPALNQVKLDSHLPGACRTQC